MDAFDRAGLPIYMKGFEYFILLYALVCVIPTAWLMYFERKTYFIKYTLPRVKQRTYILTKAIMSMLVGSMMIFGISIVSLIIELYNNVRTYVPLRLI